MWIPTAIAAGPFLYFFGLIDLVIAISLAVAAALQGQNLPHNKSGCTDFIMSHPPNSTAPSFFIVVGAKNDTLVEWRSNCEGTVIVWSIEIAVRWVCHISKSM